MDLSKISKVVSAKVLHKDLLGNTITEGDIVAIAYHNNMHYGLVYKTNDRFIYAYDKIQMENGRNINIGRGITGDKCIIIQKLVSDNIKDNMSAKVEENKIKEKEEIKKNSYKKVLFWWKDNKENKKGYMVYFIKDANKSTYTNLLSDVTTKYPNFEFFILDKYLNLKNISSIEKDNVKFFSKNNPVITWNEYIPDDDKTYFTLMNVPVEVFPKLDSIKLVISNQYADKQEHVNVYTDIDRYTKSIVKDIKGLEIPYKQYYTYRAVIRSDKLLEFLNY